MFWQSCWFLSVCPTHSEALAFATEPVFASLANVLGNLTSVTSVPKDLQDYQLYDVEIKHGLMQVFKQKNKQNKTAGI